MFSRRSARWRSRTARAFCQSEALIRKSSMNLLSVIDALKSIRPSQFVLFHFIYGSCHTPSLRWRKK